MRPYVLLYGGISVPLITMNESHKCSSVDYHCQLLLISIDYSRGLTRDLPNSHGIFDYFYSSLEKMRKKKKMLFFPTKVLGRVKRRFKGNPSPISHLETTFLSRDGWLLYYILFGGSRLEKLTSMSAFFFLILQQKKGRTFVM